MEIWEACREAVVPERHEGELLRMVESQEQVATRSLVDDLAEQALLEQMLEQSKPPLPDNASNLDYLLSTPFRYPPLELDSISKSVGCGAFTVISYSLSTSSFNSIVVRSVPGRVIGSPWMARIVRFRNLP